jgi:hypothetical protein
MRVSRVLDLCTHPTVHLRDLSLENSSSTVRVSYFSDSRMALLMVYIRIKLQVDLQADKSSVVVKGPFFPQV